MTKHQEELLNKISHKQDGWANGHDSFMICGVDVPALLEVLEEIANFDNFSYAEFNDDKSAITFDGNGDRFNYCGDLLEDISKKFPQARCYWADQWDNPFAIEMFQNGVLKTLEDGLPIKINYKNAYEEDGDIYFSIDGAVIDEESHLEMIVGCGMIPYEEAVLVLGEEDAKDLIANVSEYEI